MTAENFSYAASASGLLSYKPSKRKSASGVPATARKTSSVIQTLLTEATGNSKQRYSVLDAAWNKSKAVLESTIQKGEEKLDSGDGKEMQTTLRIIWVNSVIIITATK